MVVSSDGQLQMRRPHLSHHQPGVASLRSLRQRCQCQCLCQLSLKLRRPVASGPCHLGLSHDRAQAPQDRQPPWCEQQHSVFHFR